MYFLWSQLESTERTIVFPPLVLKKRGRYIFKVEYCERRPHLLDDSAGVMIPKGQLKVSKDVQLGVIL